jgi:Xaa-Pro aminopeptidase
MNAADVVRKLAPLRAALPGAGAGAIRLRGAGWFAWATGGADVAAVPAPDAGAPQLLVSADEACILADETQGAWLRGALPDGFTFHIVPWAETELHDTYALGVAAGRAVLSDLPAHDELPLPAPLRLRRAVLDAAEQARYRDLGRDAAVAVGEALRAARSGWTEFELAGACAHALWRRGIAPVLVHAAGEQRLALQGAPATHAPLGGRAQVTVTARRHGLHASLVRTVAFSALTPDEVTTQAALLQLEATGLDAALPGRSLAAVYHALDAGYRHANQPDAIRAARQGGITGYALHERLATPVAATGLETGMALLLTPGLGGARIADTFLLGENGLENLTVDRGWPSTTCAGRARALVLEVA